MVTHAREAVIAAVKTKLELIGIGSGWAMDDELAVHRFRGVEEIAEQFPLVFIIVAGENKSRQGSLGQRTMYHSDLTLTLEVWVEGTDLDEELSKAVHDVELTLGTDWTQGGVVIDTEITGNSIAYSEVEELRAVVFITVRLQYRYMDNVPSVVV